MLRVSISRLCTSPGEPWRVATMFRPSSRFFCSQAASEKKIDYSKTLLLPKTSFPMRANAVQVEPKYRKRCTSDLYDWQVKRHENFPDQYPLWVTHDGPPYANGSPHIGHALNKILKDIVNRYKLMSGHTISYIPGWDCHGLPIELKAIQENNILGHQYEKKETAVTLRKEAKKVASKAIKLQKKHFMEWGIMGEWEKPYLTLQPAYEAAQLTAFFEMYNKGLIYQGVRPVHWSPSSNTALAEAELEYPKSYTSKSAFCGFPLNESSCTSNHLRETLAKYPGKTIRLLIWTTTPWTLPANKGVCVHSDIEYCLAQIAGKEDLFIVATSRLNYLESLFSKDITLLETIHASDILGMTYEGLLSPGKIYEADFVSSASGTGLVHTAPGHGHDDFRVLTGKYNVEPFCPVDKHGKYTSEVGEDLEGIDVLGPANDIILEKLQNNGMLVHQHNYEHKYPHDWRTKKPVIIRTTQQWFTDLRSIVPKAVDNLKQVEMIPAYAGETFSNLLQQRTDWCISRQRCWGFPIPVFFNKETNEPLINTDTVEHLKKIVEKHGFDCWWSMSMEELLPPGYPHEKYYRGYDTVDVWFDSGVSWKSVIEQRGLPTADLYLEGADQYRGWFQSSLLTSTAVTGNAPYKQIITHGFVLDAEGRKMSKSLGNVIDPAVILHGGEGNSTAYGSDILRFWVGSVDYTKDVNISYDYVQILSETKRKIRNTVRFMLSNINDLDRFVDYNDLEPIDKYILAELYRFGEAITDHYENYQYQKVSSNIQQACIIDFSSFYFEAVKDRLYADDLNSESRRAVQTVLAHSLSVLTKVIAPIMCHMSEEIFENIPSTLKEKLFPPKNNTTSEELFSIFQTGWVELPSQWNNPELIQQWKELKVLKDSVNSRLEQLRRDKDIRQGMEAHVRLTYNPSSELGKIIENNKSKLHLTFNVSSLECKPTNDTEEILIEAEKSSNRKCERCWLYLVDHSSDLCLCPRCISVIKP